MPYKYGNGYRSGMAKTTLLLDDDASSALRALASATSLSQSAVVSQLLVAEARALQGVSDLLNFIESDVQLTHDERQDAAAWYEANYGASPVIYASDCSIPEASSTHGAQCQLCDWVAQGLPTEVDATNAWLVHSRVHEGELS